MQLPLPFLRSRIPESAAVVSVGDRTVPVDFVRHRRARHYVLRVRDDGSLRVTIPRGGSRAEAERFVGERHQWIERQWRHQAGGDEGPQPWRHGTTILLRGVETTLSAVPDGDRLAVSLDGLRLTLPAAAAGDLQPGIERHLRRLATRELPHRLAELADEHGFSVAGVSVRGQRTRWGACSPAGRITLNWRLLQLPPSVADYVMLHELAHLKHLNHSRRFWREVARICPRYEEARAWLRAHKVLGGGQKIEDGSQ